LIRGGHLQTVLPFVLPVGVAPPEPEPIEVELADGDCVVLMDSRPESWAPGDPVVLLMHGMAGCHRSHYMLRASGTMCSRGWRTFRLDHRGAGAAEGLAERPYHGGRIEDALTALRKIESLHPESPLAAVGYSLSGNLLLKLIANRHEDLPSRLCSVAAVCPAIDLVRCSESISAKNNRFYDRYFGRLLWNRSEAYKAIARELPHLNDPAERPASLYEFDARVTAPLGGFESPEHYYVESSVFHDLPRIKLPTFILAAEDDPLIPAEIFREAEYSGSTTLLMPASGGHLGFIGRRNGDPDRRWMDWRIIDWLAAHWRG
jgi:predicted alpha/beta-fold hydrolase